MTSETSSTTPAMASEYRTELGARLSATEYGSDDSTRGLQLDGRIYFSPVQTETHPLAEAAFLERVGSVGLLGSLLEFESSDGDKADGSAYGISVDYRRPGKALVLGASGIQTRADDGNFTADSTFWSLSAGAYVATATTVAVAYSSNELDSDFGDTTTTSWTLGVRSVIKTSNDKAWAWSANLGTQETDFDGYSSDLHSLGGSLTYYPSRYTGFGGALTLTADDFKSLADGGRVAVFVRHFVNPAFSFGFGYEHDDTDNSSDGARADRFTATAAVRF